MHFSEYSLQYAKVPLEVRGPQFENHCDRVLSVLHSIAKQIKCVPLFFPN